MMKYSALFFAALLGCGTSTKPAAKPAPVEIPKAPASASAEIAGEPEPPSVPAKPRLQIVVGDEMVCLRIDTSLRCWLRSAGAPGPIVKTAPIMEGLGEVVDVAIGMHHVCALNQAGQVYCWGDNSRGQLGARRMEEKLATPERVLGIEGAKAITCGMMHSCVLLANGQVSCWGWNGEGQTGSDIEYGAEARELVEPEVVPGISGAIAIAAGRDQTCAKMKSGTYCWGRAYLKSQLAGNTRRNNLPAKVDELDDVDQLVLDSETACGLFKDGHIGCWGSGAFSILPSRPLRAEEPLPVIVPESKSIAAGKYHGCAILQNGRVSCWGWNNHGELGREPQEDYTPHDSGIVEGLPAHVDSVAVGSATSCAIVHNQEIWCWGVMPNEPWVHGAGSGKPMRIPIDS